MRSTRQQEIQTLLSTILSTNLAVQPFDDYHQCEPSGTTPNPVTTRGPILHYIFLSVFDLLLLAAYGGSDTDSSSDDSNNVFENTSGARIDTDKESTTDGKTRQKTEDVVKLDTRPIN